MAALVTLLILSHTKPHMRGERVSAGPGVEYMVGPDGLLRATSLIKGPKREFKTVAHPGVAPAHAVVLLKSANIRDVSATYAGPRADGPIVAPASNDALVAERDDAVAAASALVAANEKLAAENRQLRAQLAQAPAAESPAALGAPPAPPAPPPAFEAPPAPAAGDNDDEAIRAALGLSVGKLGSAIAGGEHDARLAALRSAEVAGKNRASALGIIDARLASLAE